MLRKLWWGLFGCVLFAFAQPAFAQPMPTNDIPAPLRAWIPWVMYPDANDPNFGCLHHDGDIVCGWPSELNLTVTQSGGSFQLSAIAEHETEVALPGKAGSYPRNVRVDGHVVVVSHGGDGVPLVRVSSGSHRIEGTFAWHERPETLPAPSAIGLVHLTLDGKNVDNVRRDDAGSVWLARRDAETTAEADTVAVEVFRRIEDGDPATITTHIILHVGGRAREIALGRVLVNDAVPVAANGDIPIRLNADGDLTVQATAGTHDICITEIIAAGLSAWTAPAQKEPWPDEELWAFARNESFRQVEMDGAHSVDPARTNLPSDWRSLSAYVIARGESLKVKTVRRGTPEPLPNALSLSRIIWLDFDGNGATVQDSFSGAMHRDWRLDFPSAALGRVTANGIDQTITKNVSGATGVELRSQNVSMQAEWRKLGEVSTMPAVGWATDVQSLSATLNLPPAWKLLAATGVDDVPSSWVKLWTLWGVFFLLLVAIGFGRVYGPAAGAAAFVTIALIYHENDAPLGAWLVLAVAVAIERALSAGVLKKIFAAIWVVTALVLATQIIVFSARNVRFAIHPTSSRDASSSGNVLGLFGMADEAPPPPQMAKDMMQAAEGALRAENAPAAPAAQAMAADEASAVGARADEGGMGGIARRMASSEAPKKSANYADALASSRRNSVSWRDPNAVVQTGPGLPNWNWQSVPLRWNGPVQHGEMIHLYLLSPTAVRFLALLNTALVLLLAWFVVRGRPQLSFVKDVAKDAAAVTSIAIVFFALFYGANAHAQEFDIPPADILTQLHDRLTAKPECGEDCVSASEISVDARGDSLAIEIELHAQAASTYELPGPVATWVPSKISLDGSRDVGLARLASTGFLVMRVPAGVHRVRLESSLAGRDALSLSLPDAPARAEVSVDGWQVDGIEEGAPTGTLTLMRLVTNKSVDAPQGNAEAGNGLVLPSWLHVTRSLHFGVQWTMDTVIARQGDGVGPVSLRLPLLRGESVTSTEVTVDGRDIVIALGAGENSKSWTSQLQPSDVVTLLATTDHGRSESWRLACGPMWHCTYEGIPFTNEVPLPNANDGMESVFEPWPGEKVAVHITRPPASAGQTRTIDSAVLNVDFGTRLVHTTLSFVIRASVGGTEVITLPHGAEVRSLTVDGMSRAVQREGDRVLIAVAPGRNNVSLEWQSPFEWSLSSASPKVSFSSPAVNIRVNLGYPETERWLLWTYGPSWGPHVFFWGYLLLVLVGAFIISRAKNAGLSFFDWMMLGLGLAQISIIGAGFVALWFFAVANRRERADISEGLFNLRQVALIVLTLIAFTCLWVAVHQGLILQPDMDVAFVDGTLGFYVDRINGALPTAGMLSVPVWTYRIVMLVWSLWLAMRSVEWAKLGWNAYREGGMWKSAPPSVVADKKVEAVPYPKYEEPAPVVEAALADEPTADATVAEATPDEKKDSPTE